MAVQLQLSERMASLGTLAAGVAHEINNPLSAVMANVDLVLRGLQGEMAESADGRRRLVKWLTDAQEGADRVRRIVRDIMTFARPQSGSDELRMVDVRPVLESTIALAQNEVRFRARLTTEYGDLRPVRASESRLGQVFLNLLVNAAHAIPEGAADRNQIRVTARGEEQFVIVEIADTGRGIPKRLHARVFDPFYTTKGAGKGMGLGLAICQGIVTELGGTITVEAARPKGSVFRVVLPAMVGSPEKRQRSKTVPPVAAVLRKRILVVDDEPAVVRTVERLLSQEHDVIGLLHAREALEKIQAGQRFDAILCDLLMPEMTGMSLYRELQKVAPDQAERMIFITGGAFTPDASEFIKTVKNPHMEKPFNIPQLKEILGTGSSFVGARK